MNNNLYIQTDETKLVVINRREELTLISPIGRAYLRKKKLCRHSHGNNSHRNS